MAKHAHFTCTPLVYHRALILTCGTVTINTWHFVMGIGYYISTSRQQYIHDIVHKAFYLQHCRHYAVTTAVVLLFSH